LQTRPLPGPGRSSASLPDQTSRGRGNSPNHPRSRQHRGELHARSASCGSGGEEPANVRGRRKIELLSWGGSRVFRRCWDLESARFWLVPSSPPAPFGPLSQQRRIALLRGANAVLPVFVLVMPPACDLVFPDCLKGSFELLLGANSGIHVAAADIETM